MPVDDLKSGTWVTFMGGRAAGIRVRRCRIEVLSGPDAGLVREIEAPLIRIGARRGAFGIAVCNFADFLRSRIDLLLGPNLPVKV